MWFFSWLKHAIHKVEDRVQEPTRKLAWTRPTASGFVDMPEDQLKYIYENQKCPYCRSEYGLFEGPHGGASVNVFCGNPDCNSRFNVGDPEFGFIPMGQFTGECPEDFIKLRREKIAQEKAA